MVENEITVMTGLKTQPLLRHFIGNEGYIDASYREVPVKSLKVDDGAIQGNVEEMRILSNEIGRVIRELTKIQDKIDTKLEYGIDKGTAIKNLEHLQKELDNDSIDLPSDDDVDWLLDQTMDMLKE